MPERKRGRRRKWHFDKIVFSIMLATWQKMLKDKQEAVVLPFGQIVLRLKMAYPIAWHLRSLLRSVGWADSGEHLIFTADKLENSIEALERSGFTSARQIYEQMKKKYGDPPEFGTLIKDMPAIIDAFNQSHTSS